jgi:hypothetical protein
MVPVSLQKLDHPGTKMFLICSYAPMRIPTCGTPLGGMPSST